MDTELNDVTLAHTFEGAGPCQKCRYVLPRLVECAPTYFEKGHVICGHCGSEVELWQATLDRAIRASHVATWSLESLGAAQTSVVMQMESGNYYPVQLTDHGVPADAKILSRHYAPQGDEQSMLTAVEWHPHDPVHRIRGTVLQLFAVPLFEGPSPRKGPVLIRVTWIRRGDSDAWPYLVTALEAAAASEYAPALVFAQCAVEISMMPVIEKNFRRHASAEHVKQFMSNALTYGYALNVVLPYLCAEAGTSKTPEAIRGALNKLRKKRNAIIHQGVEASAISPEDALEGLCAAAFGLEYMRHVGPALLERKNELGEFGTLVKT
jgi:hypothetical protein